MKVTVGQIVSTPPTAQSLAVQVVREALRIVAGRLQAAGLGDRELKVDALDLTMPTPASHLATSRDRSRAATQLAGRIIGQIGPSLGLGPDPALTAGAPATGDLVHAKAEAIVRRAISAVRYAAPVKVSNAAPVAKTSSVHGAMGKVKAFFGLGGSKVEIIRTPLSQDSRDYITDFLAVEAHMRATGALSPEDYKRLRDGMGPHLTRNGVAHSQSGSVFEIKPEKRGSQLNVMAWSARKKLGITIDYDIRDRLKPGAAVGAFNSEAKHLKLDSRSVLYCRPSGTALHELHHASLYHRIDKARDSFLNLKMWNTSREEGLSSADMYSNAMSNQELSTFAKQPRQVLSLHLRDGKGYTEALDKDLRVYLWKLSQVALQGKEVAGKLIPELESYLATGQSGVLKFGTDGNGDLEVKFQSREKGLHHRISVHTHGDEHKKKVGASKASGQEALARDLLEKMQLTRDVSELLMLQSHVVMGELGQLNVGQDLLPEEIQALKDLTSWSGYGVRVASDPQRTFEERRTELARQRSLAESRLGLQPGGVMTLPLLEIGSSSGGGADDEQYVRMSPMAIRPSGALLPIKPTEQQLALSTQLQKIAADADEKTRNTRWFTRALDWMFPKTHKLSLTQRERLAAEAVGGQVRDEVIAKHLNANRGGGQISLPKIAELNAAFLAYAARNGITVHHQVGAPAVIPDAADFTKMTHADTDKGAKAGLLARMADKALENNPRHEVVHTMHMTQVRVTVMKQVCEKHAVGSVHELGPDALREIQERVQRFEGGSNYHQYEIMACRTGGPGGRLNRDESEYRASLMQGTREVEDALKRDDQRLNVSSWTRDPNDVLVWQKVYRALRDYFGNVTGLAGSMTGQIGRLGDSQTKMAANLFAPTLVAAAVAGTVGLPVAICLPIVYWFLLQHGTRAGLREMVAKLGPKPKPPEGGA